MKGKGIFFFIGIALIFLQIRGLMQIKTFWIVGCFIIWFILLIISIHKKNKDRDTPKPVYVVNG